MEKQDVGKAITEATKTLVISSANIVGTAADTADKTFKGVTRAAVAATSTVANTVETIDSISARIKNSTDEMAKRRAAIEREKTRINETESSAEATKKIQKLELDLRKEEFEFEQKNKKLEAEQALIMNRISTNSELSIKEQEANNKKISESVHYGFASSSSPFERGKKRSLLWRKWDYYFIPIGFTTKDNTFFEIELPEKLLRDTIDTNITVIVKDPTNLGQPGRRITIYFIKENKWSGLNTKPVISYIDDNTTVEYPKLLFLKKWLYNTSDTFGGKKRGTNKKTNKKTNRRTIKRRKTNRKTNKRRNTNRRR